VIVDPDAEVNAEESISEAAEQQRNDQPRSSPLVIESRSSTWFFDTEHHRFRQVLKRGANGHNVSEWRTYDHLIEGPDAFLVFLDAQGSRVIRARRTERLTPRDRARA
jgi:hypothetical protein